MCNNQQNVDIDATTKKMNVHS